MRIKQTKKIIENIFLILDEKIEEKEKNHYFGLKYKITKEE